ncbi:aliphatic sulfonate ABC transporter substrate-binding protein [Aestuariivirga sp.]|uniref:aliphatic sulfonate ABC transporter substrate-binding protein n=1 Tax=Aestuariivirga sp. TaxID=2650926 RepID=UPI0039E6BFB9
MPTITRRQLGLGAFAAAATLAVPVRAATSGTIRIGYQKTNLPVIAKQQHVVEDALKDKSVNVEWVEFNAGPPIIEALNAGAINVGWTGDAPPIFGQAAGAKIVYVAALPSNGKGEAVIAKPSSGITTIEGLKGKKVAVGKGTSAHNLLVAALESKGLSLNDIEVHYLPPPDASAAFAADQVDAWSIWDPFLAVAEVNYKPTVLVRSPDVLKVNTYFLANPDFAKDNGGTIDATLAALKTAAAWADANRGKVAEALHEVTGVPLEAQTLAAERAQFGIFPLTPEIIAGQQATADRFFKLGLIPKEIKIADAVWAKA